MLKIAGLEKSNVTDSDSGKEIYVSTTARKTFREAWPDDLAHVRNNIMNLGIATLFAGGTFVQTFKPRGQSKAPQEEMFKEKDAGIIRQVDGGRFIAIEGDAFIKIITVKGQAPKLPALPEGQKPAPYKASQGELFSGSGGTGGEAGETSAPAKPAIPEPVVPVAPEQAAPAHQIAPVAPSVETAPEYHNVPAYPAPTPPVAPETTSEAPEAPEQPSRWEALKQRLKGLF